MKIRVAFTVDIDPKAWAEEYGVERGEVRADVVRYVAESVHSFLVDAGMLSEGE